MLTKENEINQSTTEVLNEQQFSEIVRKLSAFEHAFYIADRESRNKTQNSPEVTQNYEQLIFQLELNALRHYDNPVTAYKLVLGHLQIILYSTYENTQLGKQVRELEYRIGVLMLPFQSENDTIFRDKNDYSRLMRQIDFKLDHPESLKDQGEIFDFIGKFRLVIELAQTLAIANFEFYNVMYAKLKIFCDGNLQIRTHKLATQLLVILSAASGRS